ncbi:hypothetical protein [Dactylosporangium sp. NPDC050588]|uniref:hypothetical protein n=1 Tax=Dactylosporangium sp. NPDC050588 TaxID=3157211 RepID=UPI0033D456F2
MAESYQRWRLPQLWEMLTADDPEHAHLHLATLRRQQTALETQRDRLRLLRDHLAEGWPPERSGAALAFQQRVNDMIEAMTQAAIGAAEVRTNLAHIVAALGDARTDLAPLVAKYESAVPHPDPRIVRQVQKSLDERAREVFMGTDKVVAEATARLAVTLPTYGVIRDRVQLESAVPAQVPGSDPRTPRGGDRGFVASRVSGRPASPAFEPPAPIRHDDIDEGFDLAVDRRVEPQISAVGGSPLDSSASGGFGTRAVSAISNGVIGGPVIVPGQSELRAPNVRGPMVGMPQTGASVMPRTGVGGAPMSRGAPGGPAVRSGTSASGGYRDRSFEEYATRRQASHADPDGQWVAPEGVAPMIEAPKDRPHDPGPGVLGIDR